METNFEPLPESVKAGPPESYYSSALSSYDNEMKRNESSESISSGSSSNIFGGLKTPEDTKILCEKSPPILKSAMGIINGYNGKGLLTLYKSLKTRSDMKMVIRKAIGRWLEGYGADYFAWVSDLVEKPKWVVESKWKKELGRGSFSKAHLLVHNNVKKVLKLQKNTDMEICEISFKEIAILQKSSHTNILKMYDSGILNNRVWILLEFANGTLTDHIESIKVQKISDYTLLDWYSQIFTGISYIHKKNIIHRDIKPSNIFVFKENDSILLKLGDFNLSRELNVGNSSHAKSYCGTVDTIAPEIFNGEIYRYNADVWSALCVIVYTLTTKRTNPISISTGMLMNKIPQKYQNYKCLKIIPFLHHVDPKIRPSSFKSLLFIQSLMKSSDIDSMIAKRRKSSSPLNFLCRGKSLTRERSLTVIHPKRPTLLKTSNTYPRRNTYN
tara:strand:- start:12918 stop:14243 length:1326 start_codon:yes stop_codon:yes gene_type:complete